MKKKSYVLILFLILSSILLGCSDKQTQDQPIELTISAAASLQDAMRDIASNYEEKHKNIKIVLNLGGSGALEQQINQGAPVDLFFSASKTNFSPLVEKGLIDTKYKKDLLTNELVLITEKKSSISITSFEDLLLPNINKISIGAPESVPAGMYAKQVLKHLDLWDDVESKIVAAKDVRQVMTYTETGNVEAGIVYATDAKLSKQISIAARATQSWHDPITYPAGVLTKSKHKKEATLFYHYLLDNESKKVFTKYGFKVLE